MRPLTEEELLNEPNLKKRDRGFLMVFENISSDEVKEVKYLFSQLSNKLGT